MFIYSGGSIFIGHVLFHFDGVRNTKTKRSENTHTENQTYPRETKKNLWLWKIQIRSLKVRDQAQKALE